MVKCCFRVNAPVSVSMASRTGSGILPPRFGLTRGFMRWL